MAMEMATRLNWPMPIIADSGNGAHVFWPISLPNKTTKEFGDGLILIESVIKAMNVWFSDTDVKIDMKMGNAARIIKLHGTTTRKGANIPERPWRQAKIISTPDKITTVTKEQLQYLADLYIDTQVVSRSGPIIQQTYGNLDVGKWLEEHGIDVARTKINRDGGTTYVLEHCPWNEEHGDQSAYVMQFKSGAVVAKCHHDGCQGKTWGDLRRMFEPEAAIKMEEERPAQSIEVASMDEFPLNSLGDMERLYALHPNDLKYCVESATWMQWDGVKWSGKTKDETPAYAAMHEVLDLLIAKSHDETLDKKQKEEVKLYCKRKGCAAMFRDTISLAKADSRFSCSILDFDQDELILNTESGVLDLRELTISPNRPDLMISKSVGYAYDDSAVCPRFIQFLNEIFDNDDEQIAYIQRLIGYCLTGSIREKSFCIFWGPAGDNGKSVLTTVMRMLLGDYAVAAKIETFLYTRNSNSVRDDLANLRGARLITMSEPEENTRFAIGLIKHWTGRNPIRCRQLYGSEFTYTPVGKLVIEANIKPAIYEKTDAAWNRVHVVPFRVTIPKAKQDKDLEDKLQDELPGILNWALDGLREYYRLNGLHPTVTMRTEAAEYQAENDSTKMFFDDCCIAVSQAVLSHQELYREYKTYCDANGIRPLGIRKFVEAIEPHIKNVGGCKHRTNRGLTWFGVVIEEQGGVPA